LATGPSSAASSTVELTGYTKQGGYALIEIDDQAVVGKIKQKSGHYLIQPPQWLVLLV